MANEAQANILRVPDDVIISNVLEKLKFSDVGNFRRTCRTLNSNKIQKYFFTRQASHVIKNLREKLSAFDFKNAFILNFTIVIDHIENYVKEYERPKLEALNIKLQKCEIIGDSELNWEPELRENFNNIIPVISGLRKLKHEALFVFVDTLKDALKILVKVEPIDTLKPGSMGYKLKWAQAKRGFSVISILGGVSLILTGAILLTRTNVSEKVSLVLLCVGGSLTTIGAGVYLWQSPRVQSKFRNCCNFFRSQPALPPLDIEAAQVSEDAQTEESPYEDISLEDKADEENIPLASLSTTKFRKG